MEQTAKERTLAFMAEHAEFPIVKDTTPNMRV